MNIVSSAESFFSATSPSVAQYDNIAGGALGRGIDALMAKEYDTAVREFRRTIALSPFSDNALKAYEYMANAQVSGGKTSEAMKTYQQAIKVFPSADGLNLSLGNVFFSEGRYEEAVEQYATAVKKNPTMSQNTYSLGQGYLALEDYDEAAEQFKKVIRLAPRDSGGYYALGQTYRMAGQYDEAQEQFDKALSLKKDFADVHYELGMLYAEQQKIDQAREELDIIKDSEDLAAVLQVKIYEMSAPKVLAAYITNLDFTSPAGTEVSYLDSSLATAGARKNYTVNFIFDKGMDPASLQNITNWSISRSSSAKTGGLYNWGMKIPSTEVAIAPLPLNVIYDPDTFTAKVTFTIAQNSAGNGTIDLSHVVFKFKGTDVYGNSMDDSADEYSGISKIV